MQKDVDIAQVSSDKGLDMLGKMLPYFETILNDPDYVQLRSRTEENKELTMRDIMGDSYRILATKNRKALYGIVGAVTGKSEKEVAEQPLEETIAVLEGATGNKILGFFIFFARMVVRL